MTTVSAPAMSSEHRGPLFQNAKNRIASLSSKNEEFLDQINKLQHSHSQALTAINNQLETISHTDDSEHDNLVNKLKFRQRRSNSLQQQSISSVLRTDKLGNGKDLEDVMEVEDDYKMNEKGTITANDSLSSIKSAKLAMANRTVKELKKIENLTPNNNSNSNNNNINGGELDRKYFSTNISDSEDGNENISSMEDKDFENMNDLSLRRRTLNKSHPMLTINTKNTKSSQRLITPESSDSEFDMSNAHMPLAPTLGGSRNPLRVARHSSAEHYNGNITERRGRSVNPLFSMDDAIEEERGSLSDVAEQSEINNTSENINRIRGKQITSANGRKRTQKYMDDYSVGNDATKTIKMHRRPQTDDSYADIPDDNSSIMSTDSYLQIEELRARIQRLESERIDDEHMSERKSQRRKKNHSDSIISPAALSPDGSLGGTSSTTSVTRRSSSALAQHQKHLQNAFDMFEKAFTTDHPTDDSSPPPSHSMAMVVSSALSLNQKLRSVMAQIELDGQLSEKGLKPLLKTSDEQVRSLTECLLALAPLAPKRVSTKKMEKDQLGLKGYAYYPNDSSLLPTARSISPISRISSAPAIVPHESQIGEHDQSSRRVSPVPPSDQSSPPSSYYIPQRTTSRYSRVSGSSSPTLQPEYNDSQISAPRVLERKSRRSSGTAYNSYSGANPSSSPSPPPTQHPPTHYDQRDSRGYYEREIIREAPRELPRLQRYSLQGYNNATPQPASSVYQRTTSRPSSLIRTDELSYPSSNHVRTSSTSSIHRSSSGRSYVSRIGNEEYANSPVSATRSQTSRLYEYTRRHPSDGQSPIERRSTPGLETDRRHSRRIVTNQIYEPEDGYDGSNGYGENIPERDYIRDDKVGIRRNISNGSGTYRQKMVPAREQGVDSNVGVGIESEESRSEGNQQNDEINDQNVQVNGSNVENGEENDEFI